MTRIHIEIKNQAIRYRKSGYSIKEIARLLSIAPSTVSLWSRNISLSREAKKRLLTKIKHGQYVAAENRKLKTDSFNLYLFNLAKHQVNSLRYTKEVGMLICAMIYWCEGNKSCGVRFTNSDPDLAKRFIDLLEKYYEVPRTKIRALLHLHEYHNPERQEKFWAEKLGLSKKQFHKFYLKPNTGKRTRNDYPGCISIGYYDTIVARKLLSLARAYLNKSSCGGFV